MNLRLIAAQIIDAVTDGHSLSDSLETKLATVKDARDRGFIQAVVFGVCRYYTYLDVLLSYLLQKPMKAKDSDVHALLLVGLYQLCFMRVPPHAAVAETVNAAGALRQPWARGLVNAVLREYLRHGDQVKEKMQGDLESDYAHPAWWIHNIKKAWPEHWRAILEANNTHPPFALRVNARKIARDDYLTMLIQAGITASAIPETEHGIIVPTTENIEALPGFAQGLVSVQDGAAQLAASLLALAPGQRVLDACAAPGGKLAHLLEIAPQSLTCIAVEKEKSRMHFITDNLKRLSLQAACVNADVGETNTWWDGVLFDRILLDAPCSASGVIRRHPDIKLLRQPTDIASLARTQRRLLDALWPLLKPHGLLLYATCSIFPEENVQVIKDFLATHPDATEEPIQATWGLSSEMGRQILPGMHNMDGFYYACLRK